MSRIPHPRFMPENALILRRRNRYRDLTRLVRYSLITTGGVLGITWSVFTLVPSLRGKVPDRALSAFLGIAIVCILVPLIISFAIWHRFRLPNEPVQPHYGELKDDTVKEEPLTLKRIGGWEGFWDSTTWTKTRFLWASIARWAIGLRGRQRECDAAVAMEVMRTRVNRLDEALRPRSPERGMSPWERSRYRNSHGLVNPYREDRRRASEAQVRTQREAARAAEVGYGTQFEPWMAKPSLWTDPWRLGLPDMRVTPAPGTPLYNSPQPPSVQIEPATPPLRNEPFDSQDDTSHGNPGRSMSTGNAPFNFAADSSYRSPAVLKSCLKKPRAAPPQEAPISRSLSPQQTCRGPRSRFPVNTSVNHANTISCESGSVDSFEARTARRVRLSRPGFELYRRESTFRQPSARHGDRA